LPQEQPTLNLDLLQQSLPAASAYLAASRGTDAEFLYSPSQIALACWHRASPGLVEGFLNWRYGSYRPGDTLGVGGGTATGSIGGSGTSTPVPIPQEEQNEEMEMENEPNEEKVVYGMKKERLLQIVAEITALIDRVEEAEIKKVKEVDKRLKACTNPEKVPGTAL
jgi:cyclin H